ncbi:MAG: MFS transporter [Hyphomonadaceae bacterium]|nr:MFS transporter [Hyphomonadaceae bacterium]
MPPAPSSTGALLRERDYVIYWASRSAASIGVQIQSVTIGWQMYEIARRTMPIAEAALQVGFIGLCTFIPLFVLALPAGEIADRRNRRNILIACNGAEALTAAALLWAAATHSASIPFLLAAALAFGAARAFLSPAATALAPMLVPRELLPRAIAWNSLAWQTAAIAGPAIGGLLVSASPAIAYAAALALYIASIAGFSFIRKPTKPVAQAGGRLHLIREGLAYTWRNKIVFGAISLDLFAVLLGGATALLPVFARDVLHVGPEGFGILRAAPAVGASLVALYLAANPIRRHAGPIMFWGVAVFGFATIVFGLSSFLWFPFAVAIGALATLGGADMLSVFVRQTLVQIVTPDHMRGRVAAVSTLFIGASNELGEFESGVVARFLGPIGAALFGGVGAVAVTALWAKLFPELRKTDRLE